MLTLQTLTHEMKQCGYTLRFDTERDFHILEPNEASNQHFPEAIVLWPEEEDSTLEILIPIMEYDFKKNLLEVLKFVTLFNWESVPGKLVYTREDELFYYHLIFPVSLKSLTPEDVAMNFMSGAMFIQNILETLKELISGKYDADEALESMSELEECLMASMKSIQSPTE